MVRATVVQWVLILVLASLMLLDSVEASRSQSESQLNESIGPAGVPVPISPVSILSTRKAANATAVASAASSKTTPITSSSKPTPTPAATPAKPPAAAAATTTSLPAAHDESHPTGASPGAPLPASPSAAALDASSSTPSIADIEGVEEVDSDDDSSDKDEADSSSDSSTSDDDLKAPDEDAKIARELAAHDAHIAEHTEHESAEQAAHDKEHQDNSHSTHEVDAVALHHGVITTNADAQTIHAADLNSHSPVVTTASLPGTEGKSDEIRNSARLLLRKLAAERVAQAKQAVRAAVHRQRFAQAYSNGGIDMNFNALKKSPDLVEVDHSHDDEPDDDVGRDKALLKFAMEQMVHASRKKNNEIEQLLDALKGAANAKHDKKEKEAKEELEELAKEKRELQVEKEELEAKEKAATNWTLWILLSIGLLCLCIAIPIVWTYWMKTWIVQQATGMHPALAGGNNPNVAYRSINAVGGSIEAVSPYDDDLLIVDEDGNSYDASHPSRHALRFETRKKTPVVQQPRVVVVKKVSAGVASGSASPSTAGASSSRAAGQSRRAGGGRKTASHATHAANFPEFDPHADEHQSDSYGENEEEPALSPTTSHIPPSGRKGNKSNRPPPAAQINPEELSDGEDLAEEASMIGSARY